VDRASKVKGQRFITVGVIAFVVGFATLLIHDTRILWSSMALGIIFFLRGLITLARTKGH
jgi:hypothetical protein